MLTLETPRLRLREMTLADAPDMFRLNADPEVIRYTGDQPFATLQEAEDLVRDYPQYRLYQRGRLLMHLKSTGEFVGWCGLKYLVDENETDLGYRLLRRFWNQGYATEASCICLEYGFNELGLSRIIARALPENVASVKVMQKLGMQPEGYKQERGQRWQQFVLTAETYRLQTQS